MIAGTSPKKKVSSSAHQINDQSQELGDEALPILQSNLPTD